MADSIQWCTCEKSSNNVERLVFWETGLNHNNLQCSVIHEK